MKDEKTTNGTKAPARFSQAHQPANRRGKAARTKLLDAILAETGHDEQGFYQQLVKQAITGGDTVLLKEVMSRLSPAPRSTMQEVHFDFTPNSTPYEQCTEIIAAIACGTVPPDVGNLLVNTIKTAMDVREASELAEKLEALEAKLAASGL